MATSVELEAFATSTAFDIPTVDYAVGAPGTSYPSFLTMVGKVPGVTYDSATKILHIKADNTSLSGYDFSGCTVSVEANNVKITNSTFDASTGFYSIIQANGKSGLTVDHCTFDGLKLDNKFCDFVHGGNGNVTVTYSKFLNAPSDCIQLKAGTVDHNYFSGAGYATGAHADAVTVDGAVAPVTITNNFVDYRNSSDAPTGTTSAIAVANWSGDCDLVTVSSNVLLGGAYTVYVTDFGTYDYKSVRFTDNIVDAGSYGSLYPKNIPDALVYSDNAGADIGLQLTTKTLLSAGISVSGTPGVSDEYLIGTAGSDHIYGHGENDHLVGGGGRDYLFGGRGTDIFVYKATTDSGTFGGDVIGGFEDSLDKFDFRAIDAKPNISGHQDFDFIETGAFTGAGGEIRAIVDSAKTTLEIDINGDRVADMRIELTGAHNLTDANFLTSPQPTPTPTPTPTPLPPVIEGTAGTNWLHGKGNGNVLIGHEGRDFLFGRAGLDIFAYTSAADSKAIGGDVIGGFEDGADRIDFSAIDANPNLDGDQSLTFKSGGAFSGKAGEVIVTNGPRSSFVSVDLNGDSVADMRVELLGAHSLTASNFIL